MTIGKKRICAALSALCIAASVFSGCGAPSGGADTSNASEKSSSAADNSVGENKQTASNSASELSVEFSLPAGFYDEDITLELTCTFDGAKIYYTSDGSEPTESSTLYTAPITLSNRSDEPNVLSAIDGINAGESYIPKAKVKKANVIRAAAFLPDGRSGEIASNTYFVGINREEQYDSLPVISLFTDPDNLFSSDKGIYVLGDTYKEWVEEHKGEKYEAWEAVGNYSNSGREWERPVTVQYIPYGGGEGFTQDFGMRIMGAASRSSNQKSLKIIAREDYGAKNLKYDLIPENMKSDGSGKVEKYKSFILRNGGNDCDFAKIRDPFFQSLVSDKAFETQQSSPCVVYIDGEYWGLYTVTEDYSDNYFENNYGIDNKNIVLLKRGEIEDGNDDDIELYNKMYDFITGNDMSDAENYEKACGMIDMQSLWDYCALDLYIYNEDGIFEDNNWRMWRVRNADGQTEYSDGRWRMVVYDIDFSSGIYNGGDFSSDNITKSLYGKSDSSDEEAQRAPRDIIRALCASGDFMRGLVNSLCDMRNINMNSEAAEKRLNEMYALYQKGAGKTFRRFGPNWVAQYDTDRHFTQKIGELANFVDGRYRKFPDIMQKAMNLSPAAELTLSSSDSAKGSVIINSTAVSLDKEFKGKYFPDYPVTLTAVPENGRSFVRWETEGCTLSDPAAQSVTVTFNGDFTVKAVFE